MQKKDMESSIGKKCAIVVIAIGQSEIWEISRRSILEYCNKYNIPLEIISERKYSENYERNNIFNMFEKNQIYDLFEKYDRILRLDWDVIITPICPNLFSIVPEEKIGAVFEDKGTRKSNRRNRIKIIQDKLGNIGWSSGYINAGIILTSKQHRKIFYTTDEDLEILKNINVDDREQTFLNYTIRKLRFKIYSLSYKFNHMSLFSEPWNKCQNRLQSYIIHYAGSKQEQSLKRMQIDYYKLFIKKKIKLEGIFSYILKRKLRFYKIYKIWFHFKEDIELRNFPFSRIIKIFKKYVKSKILIH